MQYSIEEILINTSGVIYYQSERFDKSEQYMPCAVSELCPAQNCIFIPLYIHINSILTDSFWSLERMINLGIRCIMFDRVRFREQKYKNLLDNIIQKYKDKLDLVIMVPDTLHAIFDLANYTRTMKLPKSTKIVAVTGSIGKTSTTEMVYAILKTKYKTYRGVPTVNIRLRIAHKFLEAPPNVEYLLFECSGQQRGYLKWYSELLVPDGAIVTKIANENLGEYLTLKNLAQNKASLLSAMGENSTAVLNGDPLLRKAAEDYICKKIFVDDKSYELLKTDKDGSEFIYKGEKYFIPVVGIHQIDNAVKAIELTQNLGFTADEIRTGLSQFQAVGDRWVVDKFQSGAVLITDCPNNPSYDTLMSAISTFMDLYKGTKYKRLIISRIKLLGEYEAETYMRLAKYISTLDIQELVCVGEEITSIRDYVSENSNIKVVYFEKPKVIDKNDEFVKYLINTLNFEQATLLKMQRQDVTIKYGKVKEVLRAEVPLQQV